MKFSTSVFSISVLFWEVVNQLPNRRWTRLLWCRWTLLALETNTVVLETIASKRMFDLKPHTHTHLHVATNDFQTDLPPKWLQLTSTHLWKQAVSSTRTHLCGRYIDKFYLRNSILCWNKRSSTTPVDKENDKQTSTYTQLVLSKYLTAYNTCIQYAKCSQTIVPHPQLLCEKPSQCLNKTVKLLGVGLGRICSKSYLSCFLIIPNIGTIIPMNFAYNS